MSELFFTLENVGVDDGAEAALADWGVDDFSLTVSNQAVDTCELYQQGRAYDAAFLFPFQSTVVLREDRVRAADGTFSGGRIFFRGLVQFPGASATGRRQSQRCTLIGPGWFLAERVFEQEYREIESITGGEPTFKDPNPTRSRIFLNLELGEYGEVTVTKLSLGEQLKEIFDWVRKPFVDAAAPPPFNYVGAELDALATDPPVDEVKNITCAEAARKMYRWIPDVVQWFDYSTTPPTLHVKRRAALTSRELDVRLRPPTALELRPRLDLQRPYVKIQYEIRDELDGFTRERVVLDVYPDPLPTSPLAQFAGVPFVVDLRGYTRVTAPSVSIETQAIDTESADWWLSNLPAYARALEPDGDTPARITSISFDFGSVKIETEGEDLELPRQLIQGQPSDAIPAQWQRVRASVEARVTYANGSVLPDKTFSFDFTATNATTGTYGGGGVFDEGDPVPVGLAEDFYTAINGLQFDGSLSFTEENFTSLPSLGEALNVVGTDNAAHATMAAVVQRVTRTSRTWTAQFGPPPHLDVSDLVSLLRVSRNRDPKNPYSIRVGGGGGGGGGGGLRSASPIRNSLATEGNFERIVAKEGATSISHNADQGQSVWNGGSGGGTCHITLEDIFGKAARFREFHWMDRSDGCKEYRAWILMTEPEEVEEE